MSYDDRCEDCWLGECDRHAEPCFSCGEFGCPGYCDDYQTYNLRPAETGLAREGGGQDQEAGDGYWLPCPLCGGGPADLHDECSAAAAVVVAPRCASCGGAIRWADHGFGARWVHVSIADMTACPDVPGQVRLATAPDDRQADEDGRAVQRDERPLDEP